MASGDTKTESYLRAAAEGTRADLPADSCCNTKTQNLILGVANRIMDVEDEVERLENNPDVVDIVATYADLQSYDTSTLTDKDIIRVLEDSTHNNNSTYYRWNATTNQFDFVGEISGGSSVNVVQTTGTSTTDVMSQDATRKMIFNTSQSSSTTIYPTTQVCIGRNSMSYVSKGIAIGDSSSISGSSYTDAIAIGNLASAHKYGVSVGGQAKALGDGTTAIGCYAGDNTRATNNHNTFLGYYASAADSNIKHSVALGSFAKASRNGEVNVGTSSTTNGYDNTSYRVIGGVHDGQDAHDAVTVSQVNSVIDSINTALSTNIPHIGV